MTDQDRSAPSTDTTGRGDRPEPELQFYGGPLVAVVPGLVLVGILLWLSLAERASITSFWVGGWAAVVVALLLTKTRKAFADSVVRGWNRTYATPETAEADQRT